MVALAIGVVVVLGARALMDALATQARATVRVASAGDARANARDGFRALVGDLVLARDTVASLSGDSTQASFRSYCESVHGWMEQCQVGIFVQRTERGYEALWTANGDTVVLGDSLSTAGLRYLLAPRVGGLWTSQWRNTVMLPVAIAVVMDRDTLLATIGDRQ